MIPQPHFTALVTFAPEKESGRSTPASSGYRAAIRFSADYGDFMSIQNFTDAELIFPGDSVNAEITLLAPESIHAKLYEGLDFDFFEADVLAGSGVITKINNPF